jgi:cap1 methyltransferase
MEQLSGDDHHNSKRIKAEAPSEPGVVKLEDGVDALAGTHSATAATNTVKMSAAAEQMMSKMGHVDGQGLGRSGQGIVTPIEASNQSGRLGLGYKIEGLEKREILDQELEEVNPHQVPPWMPPAPYDVPTDFEGWMIEGRCVLKLESETRYSDEVVVEELLQAKTLLDGVDDRTFLLARDRANPFEGVKKEFFQNRVAMKVANIDAVFGFMFTKPVCLSPTGLLYFADICAGPGGFTEYIFWRKKWRAKGFGFTLAGKLDFNLSKFNSESPKETFHCYYGDDTSVDKGDIYSTKNMQSLRQLVTDQTDGQMLHFVMADGGFDVTGNENIQEILNKQLLLCQVTTALALLRNGGNFTCKAFDLFTPFSVGLVYILYRHFQRVSLFKPHTSRPANSERYFVCEGLRTADPPILTYLWAVNDQLNAFKPKSKVATQTKDIVTLVPPELFEADLAFVDYVVHSNNVIGWKQIRALKKLHNFLREPAWRGPSRHPAIVFARMERARQGSHIRAGCSSAQRLLQVVPREGV